MTNNNKPIYDFLKETNDELIKQNKNLFVKFCRFDVNTLTKLKNKEIKFSTVFEFNDFNELNYSISNPNNSWPDIYQ